MQDSYANVDERSLQHHGSYALALTRRFANLDLPAPKQSNAVYFNAFSALFINYSSAWVLPLTAIVTVLFIAVAVYGYKKRRLTISGFAFGVLAFALSVSAAYGITRLTWWLIYRFGGAQEWLLPDNNAYNANSYLLSFVALSVAVTAVIYLFFSRKVEAINLALGALLWWVVLMIVVTVYMPGGSYLLTWPLLFGWRRDCDRVSATRPSEDSGSRNPLRASRSLSPRADNLLAWRCVSVEFAGNDADSGCVVTRTARSPTLRCAEDFRLGDANCYGGVGNRSDRPCAPDLQIRSTASSAKQYLLRIEC
jgi:hypothetical protein